MKINSIKATNFLCFGSEPLFIDFTKLGKIVCIKGENRDYGENASNGSGKTTLIESIVYALYGDLVKNLTHAEVINVDSKDKMCVEIDFEMDGHQYLIVRKRGRSNSDNSLTVFKDGKEEKLGGIPDTQKAINAILRLNYDAFINITCFGQHNDKPFLSSTPAQKRAIAESLLSLDKYNKYCAAAKKKKSELLQKLEMATALYEKSVQMVESSERQIVQIKKQQDDWRASQLNTIERLKTQIKLAREEMTQTNPNSADSYQTIALVESEIAEKTVARNETRKAIDDAEAKVHKIREDRQTLMLTSKELAYSISKDKREIEELKTQCNTLLTSNGTKCKACFGIIRKENFAQVLNHNEETILELVEQVKAAETDLEAVKAKMTKMDKIMSMLATAVEDARIKETSTVRRIRDLETKRASLSAAFQRNADAVSLIIEQKIATLSDQLTQKQTELEAGDPYGPILKGLSDDFSKAKLRAEEGRKEVDTLNGRLPYYEFWIEGFGDNGIRSFIIDEIVPLLNSRINFWLQFLIDNKIKLTFDNKLVETIKRNPSNNDGFVHRALSGGEIQRINLGISQGFANITSLKSNCCPSIISLDEVGTNLDRPGIASVYATICELARERQVLVTTHDPDLLEMLSGHDCLTVIKENGISRIKK